MFFIDLTQIFCTVFCCVLPSSDPKPGLVMLCVMPYRPYRIPPLTFNIQSQGINVEESLSDLGRMTFLIAAQ